MLCKSYNVPALGDELQVIKSIHRRSQSSPTTRPITSYQIQINQTCKCIYMSNSKWNKHLLLFCFVFVCVIKIIIEGEVINLKGHAEIWERLYGDRIVQK